MLAIFIDLMSKSQWADIVTKLSTDYWKYKGFHDLPDGLKGNILEFCQSIWVYFLFCRL